MPARAPSARASAHSSLASFRRRRISVHRLRSAFKFDASGSDDLPGASSPSGKVVTPPNPSGTLILSPDDESFIEPTDASGAIVVISSGLIVISSGLPVAFTSGRVTCVCALASAGPHRASAREKRNRRRKFLLRGSSLRQIDLNASRYFHECNVANF